MSEKRHFKLLRNQKEGKYIFIFDTLASMSTYDEAQLRKMLELEGHSTKHLTADKTHLYRMILQSLNNYHKDRSINMKLKFALLSIEVLYKKGAFAQCKREVDRAGVLARSIEKHELMLNILFWERRLRLYYSDSMREDGEILEDIRLQNEILDRIIEATDDYQHAMKLMRSLAVKYTAQGVSDLDALIKRLEKPKDSDPIMLQIRYLQTIAIGEFVHERRKNELDCIRELIRLIDSHREYRNEYPLEYINTYSRVLSILKDIQPEQFEDELKKYRSLGEEFQGIEHERVQAQIFNYSYMIELSHLIRQGAYHKAGRNLRPVEEGLNRYKKTLNSSNRMTLHYISAYVLFACGAYEDAMVKVHYIRHHFNEKDRPEIFNFNRLLQILIHYELKHELTLDSLVSSAAYYFKKKPKEYVLENIVLGYFRSVRNRKDSKKSNLKKLRADLLKAQERGGHPDAFKYFDLITWVDAKLGRLTMARLKEIEYQSNPGN